jgi:methylmalonyl-CoA/ethylmalonyl-CoA epimerase
MRIARLSHVGIAVESIEKHAPIYGGTLALEAMGTEVVESQKVKVAFFKVGETRVELLEPTSQDSPIRSFLDKKGPGVHHLAYEVDDLEAALAEVKAEGVRLIDEKPRIGAGGIRIAFLHPQSTGGVLTELCERH